MLEIIEFTQVFTFHLLITLLTIVVIVGMLSFTASLSRDLLEKIDGLKDQINKLRE